ncbi:MAG: HAMP domain-containing protein [Spirochaetales bacterium]|nr:HAMP domain-containing protein [Spirochaetales bacterium]
MTAETPKLWNAIERLQGAVEESLFQARHEKDKTILLTAIPHLRMLHWHASFLGLTDLADVAALSSAFIQQIQESPGPWSTQLTEALGTAIDRCRHFLEARIIPEDPGVYQAQHGAVLPPPRLSRPVPIDDLLSMFRRRQLDVHKISACRRVSVTGDAEFHHALTIPSFASSRHRKERYMSIVYLNLSALQLELHEIAQVLESAHDEEEILLHGPLAIPWDKFKSDQARRPYYVVLDTLLPPEAWLKHRHLKGRLIRTLHVPEQSTLSPPLNQTKPLQPRQTVPQYHTPPRPSRSLNDDATSSLRFDAGEPATLEPVDEGKKRKRSQRKRIRNRDLKIRFPVGAKLIIIVSTIIIVSMTTLTSLAIFFFRQEIEHMVRDTNVSLSRIVGQQAEREIVRLFDSANLLFQVGAASRDSGSLVDDFFANDRSLVYVGVPGTGVAFSNRDWFRSNRIADEGAMINRILSIRDVEIERSKSGETLVFNVSPLMDHIESPVLALTAPFLVGTERRTLVVLADVGEGLVESVRIQEGFTTTMIVNADGEVLAHPDFTLIFGGDNVKNSHIFQEMYSQGLSEGQILFEEELNGENIGFIGSYSLIPIGNLGVVTTVPYDEAFAVVTEIQRLNLYLLGAILSLAILGVFHFSRRISTPLKELALATRQIKARNYNISIKPKSGDEVGQLTRNFINMIPELEKVDRLQERTSKFVNPQVARMIADDTLPENAETKDVTVFFSDVRGFTSMSEAMGDPQLVLDNLSEYFQVMVPCVEETQGTVDKFIGDAVMAVWGSMQDLPNPAENAINGALMMRRALLEFNNGRGTGNRPTFQIGCGLNSGPATVGMMGGGSAKEEWAHMGDTVNLASRIEALNKPMGTDILISQSTADRVEGLFSLIPMQAIKVKGKSEPQQIYAVLGRHDDENCPHDLNELRLMLGIEGDFDHSKTKADSHEVKYEILDS